MNNKASITALMSAFGRAFHAENEEHPVFRDFLAKNLMTEEEYAAVQGYILGGAQFFEPEIDPAKQEPKELLRRLVNVHIAPSPLCRAAYTEKALKVAVLTGTKQYVTLGAGMDTFAFREKEFLSKCRVFEVDHPLTQADKLERITRVGWKIPDQLTFVPVDFTKDNVKKCLIDAGFDPLYANVSDRHNAGYLGKGISLNKYTGARGKSGASDANAEYVAFVRNIFEKNDIKYQVAELGKVDVGGGGTIAYILANKGVDVIDCGIPLLSMHSPYEVTSKFDICLLAKLGFCIENGGGQIMGCLDNGNICYSVRYFLNIGLQFI